MILNFDHDGVIVLPFAIHVDFFLVILWFVLLVEQQRAVKKLMFIYLVSLNCLVS